MQNDLISRSALKKALLERSFFPAIVKAALENAPAVDAVPVERLGKIGKLFLPYKGCPRGHVGRMGDGCLEEEALFWGVITDVDGGRWVPVYEAVLLELIEKAKANDPESLRPKGRWGVHRESEISKTVYCTNCWQEFYIHRKGEVQIDTQPYCPNCGAKMEERGMNHDVTHCADYTKACPKSCYRAQLTEDSRKRVYLLPASWANFKGTNECPKWQKEGVKK